MDAIFKRLMDSNFSELKGLEINASIPVPEPLGNEIITASLQGNKNLEYCRVSIGGQNRVTADIKSPLWPWPFGVAVSI